jgi:hypothetical protein
MDDQLDVWLGRSMNGQKFVWRQEGEYKHIIDVCVYIYSAYVQFFDTGCIYDENVIMWIVPWPRESQCRDIREGIQKFPDWVDNEINNNKHLLRSNTKGYGSKTH